MRSVFNGVARVCREGFAVKDWFENTSKGCVFPEAKFGDLLASDDESLSAGNDPVIAQVIISAQRHGGADIRADGEVRVEQAGVFRERDLRCVLVAFDFLDDLDEPPLTRARDADGHGDAHRRAIGGIHPWMIRHRKHEGKGSAGFQPAVSGIPAGNVVRLRRSRTSSK